MFSNSAIKFNICPETKGILNLTGRANFLAVGTNEVCGSNFVIRPLVLPFLKTSGKPPAKATDQVKSKLNIITATSIDQCRAMLQITVFPQSITVKNFPI